MIGLALVFAGRMLLKPAVCFAGFLSTVLLSCFIFYAVYLEDTSDVADFWYFLGGGALVGIGVGILLACCVRLGAAVLAGWGGVCGGLILYEAVIYRAEMVWLFWTTIVICGLVAALLAFILMDEVVIVASTLLGAYAMVRGTACYAGHYYNEVTMADMAKEGLLDDIDPWYWMYVGGFFVMTILGLLVQCRHFKKEKAKKAAAEAKHPYMANAHPQDYNQPYTTVAIVHEDYEQDANRMD